MAKFSVVTKSVTTVLEIGLPDLVKRLPFDYGKNLKKLCIQKQIARLLRMQDIIQSTQSLREEQQYRHFFEISLKTLL